MANTLKFGNGQWATGNGTALAYNDENANFKPLPFDFTRASSATVVNQSGLIETVGSGIPRIDFKDNTKGALLLEPSRTNLFAYSQAFDNIYWVKLGTSFTVTPNNVISPNGELNASTINVTNNDNILYRSISGLSSSESSWTFSIYAKGSGTFDMNIRLNSSTTDTQTKTLTSEWQRFNVTVTRTPTITSIESYIELNTSSTYQIWGAQLEESYATSYIPTSGSSVTRVAETNRQTPPSGVIGQTEGTMFVDCKVNAQGTYTGFSLNDNTTNNEVIIRFTTQDRIEYYLRSGGSQPIGGGTTLFDTDKRVKIAFAYKSGDSSVYINGAQVTTSTTTTMPVNLSIIKFARGNSTADFSGKTNDFKVYNTRLSNAELAALTQV